MKRLIIELKKFSADVDSFIDRYQLLFKDFEDCKDYLAKYPESGELVVGTGGIRKIRLKNAHSGKSSGFRVYYFDLTEDSELYLISIYPKNKLENITDHEKKILKNLTHWLKGKKNE